MEVVKDFLQNTNSLIPIHTSGIFQILNEGVKNGGNKEVKFQHIQNIKKFT